MRRRGRTIALSTVTIGLVVLAALGFAAKDRLSEEWYLWRLEVGSEEEEADAAEELGELRSVRAVSALVARFKKASWNSLEMIHTGDSRVAFLFDSERWRPVPEGPGQNRETSNR